MGRVPYRAIWLGRLSIAIAADPSALPCLPAPRATRSPWATLPRAFGAPFLRAPRAASAAATAAAARTREGIEHPSGRTTH